MTTLFVTAHRDLHNTQEYVKRELLTAFGRAKERGFEVVICGGALGGDWLAAEGVIEMRPALQLWLALPFAGYNSVWPGRVRNQFEARIMTWANRTIYVSSPPYSPQKMFLRNEWGVDHAAAVIAVWDGRTSGGTFRAVQYARGLGRPVYRIDPINQGWL